MKRYQKKPLKSNFLNLGIVISICAVSFSLLYVKTVNINTDIHHYNTVAEVSPLSDKPSPEEDIKS